MKLINKVFVAAAVACACSSVLAATSYVSNAQVKNIRTYVDGRFGGCSAQLTVNIEDAGSKSLSCPKTELITLDCDGNTTPKSVAANAWNNIQLAFVTGRLIDVSVTDDKLGQISDACLGRGVIVKGVAPPE